MEGLRVALLPALATHMPSLFDYFGYIIAPAVLGFSVLLATIVAIVLGVQKKGARKIAAVWVAIALGLPAVVTLGLLALWGVVTIVDGL